MTSWKSRGLRGSNLEEFLNYKIEEYRRDGLALIQKVPTPITPVEMDPHTRRITLAYFDRKSTVDYIGAVQGIPICFDAKECAQDAFPVANIHPHQVAFMEDFEKQQGIAFLILFFSHRQAYYYMRFREMKKFWDRAQEGGRKSFRFEELDPAYFLGLENLSDINFLEGLRRDLMERDTETENE